MWGVGLRIAQQRQWYVYRNINGARVGYFRNGKILVHHIYCRAFFFFFRSMHLMNTYPKGDERKQVIYWVNLSGYPAFPLSLVFPYLLLLIRQVSKSGENKLCLWEKAATKMPNAEADDEIIKSNEVMFLSQKIEILSKILTLGHNCMWNLVAVWTYVMNK